MPTIDDVAAFLYRIAPARFAEDWDNVGLLVGRRRRTVEKLMTCLTVTPATAAEAIEEGADLIVSHHPMPFLAMKRITDETTPGRLLLDLIAANVAVYSPHTAYDSASEGINQLLAAGLGLRGILPLIPHPSPDGFLGAGRWGWLPEPTTLRELAERLKRFLAIERLQTSGPAERVVRTVAVACGAAAELLPAAKQNACDVLVLGEAHTCLEAQAAGVSSLLPGHYASERFAVESLADVLARQFPEIRVWASRRESDPLGWE